MPHTSTFLARNSVTAILAIAVVVLAVVAIGGSPSISHADAKGTVDIAYLFVTGEGPSAKAWFKDAPSTGLGVQDALDRFAKLGYRAKHVTDELRSTSDAVAFVILLERVR